jgi:hypothetical protein
VYCASSNPSANTYTAEPQPVSFAKCPNTNDASWCFAGTNTSTPTITSTPTRCHHTLTLLRIATTRTPNVFNAPCTTRMIASSRIVCPGVALKPHCRSRNALRNSAAPKSMPAVTAIWPIRLNQPVNHDHAGPLLVASFAAQ